MDGQNHHLSSVQPMSQRNIVNKRMYDVNVRDFYEKLLNNTIRVYDG